MAAAQEWLNERGFIRYDTPILTATSAEGTTNLFATEYFDLGNAYLAQTGQLYVESGMMSFGKVYCFGPTFRAEKSKTRRHLTEFWMIEPEVAFADHDDNLALQEQYVSGIVQRVLAKCPRELETLERDTAALERVQPPFARITYDEAIALIGEKHGEVESCTPLAWGEDFGAPHETLIAQQFDKPVFVERYPAAIKAFYMQPDPQRPELALCADLLAPEGYGEIIGGSQRIHDVDLLEQRIREHGLNLDDYQWYLDLRRYGSVPHSGFGMGVERVVAWIAGTRHIRETIPFPRMLYRLYP
jgi:asparaginyl-tRNA synthetase